MKTKKKIQVKSEPVEVESKLKQQLETAKEQALRAQADYQNLVRRTQEEKAVFVKFAYQDLVEALLQPLDHLEMAATQIQDHGLNMVVEQFRQVLHQFGVEEIQCLNQDFNVEEMEAVNSEDRVQDQEMSRVKMQVKGVRQKGYRLNGKVIRHAKVVVG